MCDARHLLVRKADHQHISTMVRYGSIVFDRMAQWWKPLNGFGSGSWYYTKSYLSRYRQRIVWQSWWILEGLQMKTHINVVKVVTFLYFTLVMYGTRVALLWQNNICRMVFSLGRYFWNNKSKWVSLWVM